MSLRSITFVAAAIAMFASPLAAQRARGPKHIPPGHYPPSGMCRIWIDGVPPGRQPRPTDCTTAYRRAPSNARVITSDGRDYASRIYERRRDGTYRDGVYRRSDRDGAYRRGDRDGTYQDDVDLKRQRDNRKDDSDRDAQRKRSDDEKDRDAELKRKTAENRK